MDDLEFDPQVFEFEKNNKQTRVTITRPVEDLVIAGKDLSSVAKGQEVSLPLWAAETLVSKGIGTTREDHKLTHKDLENTVWREQLETPLQKLPGDFYILAKEYMNSLEEKASKDARDLDSVRKLTQLGALLRDIVSIRLSKIVKISLRGSDLSAATTAMTNEELWLHQRLNKMLRSWEKGVLGDLR